MSDDICADCGARLDGNCERDDSECCLGCDRYNRRLKDEREREAADDQALSAWKDGDE